MHGHREPAVSTLDDMKTSRAGVWVRNVVIVIAALALLLFIKGQINEAGLNKTEVTVDMFGNVHVVDDD